MVPALLPYDNDLLFLKCFGIAQYVEFIVAGESFVSQADLAAEMCWTDHM
jgi:hypothetical protein